MPNKRKAKQSHETPAQRYSKYLDYINNAGGSPSVKSFDDDWEPIGPMVRQEMQAAGLARVIEGKIYLV